MLVGLIHRRLGLSAPFRIGPGLRLERDPATQLPRVVTPIQDSPAHKAGVKAGDFLIHFTALSTDPAFPTKEFDPRKMDLEKVIEALRGETETKVRLHLLRKGAPKPIEIEVERKAFKEDAVVG